jgi:hypothetical protein
MNYLKQHKRKKMEKIEINGVDIQDGDVLGVAGVDYHLLDNEELVELFYLGKGRVLFSYDENENIWYVTNIDDPQRSGGTYQDFDNDAISSFVKL